MKTYTIERRITTIKTGWFKRERKPMWCLVEYGSYVDYSDHFCDTVDYNTVILYSEDKGYIEQELFNFKGEKYMKTYSIEYKVGSLGTISLYVEMDLPRDDPNFMRVLDEKATEIIKDELLGFGQVSYVYTQG